MNASYHPGEEMCRLLREGARIDDLASARAGIHILTFTGIPAYQSFQRHVTVEERYSLADRRPQLGAWVNDWRALTRNHGLRLTSTEQRMLRLAAVLHAGTKVDLREVLTPSLGWAHAKVIAEAVLIMTGADRLLTISGTGELDQLHVLHRELSAPAPGGPDRM